jgi:S1-C subfamily serine protease
MRHATRCLAIAAIVVSGCALQRPGPLTSKSDVVQQVLPSMVQLAYEDSDGRMRYSSGVVVGSGPTWRAGQAPASYIVTSGHAVAVAGKGAESGRLMVRYRGADDRLGQALAAVEAVDEAADLAILRVEGVRLPAARFDRPDRIRVGDEVLVVGAPFGRGLSVSSGIVSQLELAEPDGRATSEALLKIDAPVGYGSSGGGVFQVGRGRLIGIVEGYRTATVSLKLAGNAYSFQVPMPGETFVVPTAEIRRFLRARGLEGLLSD